jgi:predicted RNA-binding Zn ribbon-like protein
MVTFEKPSRAGLLPLVGGELALDFANTSSARGLAAHQEHLRRAEDVVDWASHADVLAPADVLWLKPAIEANPGLAADLFDSALRLRENIHALAAALAEGRAPVQTGIDSLTASHVRFMDKARLTSLEAGFVWRWECRTDPVAAVLGPVALSAVTMLLQADLSRLKRCEGDACGWMFLDATKNGKRRWCEMEVCGNRAKQRRFKDRRGTT